MLYGNGLNKPSANMLRNRSELNRMYHEQMQTIYREDSEKASSVEANRNREYNAYLKETNDLAHSKIANARETRVRNTKIKEAFMADCLMKLYKESMCTPMTSHDRIVARNLINNFIQENGINNIMSEFETKNYILSEFSRIVDKYYDMVVSEGCKKECGETEYAGQVISKDVVDRFYTELEEVDTEDAAKAIKDRVADSITEFIDNNAAHKMECEEVIKQAQEKAALVKSDDPAIAESYITMGTRKVNALRENHQQNVFGFMVESLTKRVLTDESLKKVYVNEANVDMDGIVNSVTLMYTMLEMVNTTQMVNVDNKFLTKYLEEYRM